MQINDDYRAFTWGTGNTARCAPLSFATVEAGRLHLAEPLIMVAWNINSCGETTLLTFIGAQRRSEEKISLPEILPRKKKDRYIRNVTNQLLKKAPTPVGTVLGSSLTGWKHCTARVSPRLLKYWWVMERECGSIFLWILGSLANTTSWRISTSRKDKSSFQVRLPSERSSWEAPCHLDSSFPPLYSKWKRAESVDIINASLHDMATSREAPQTLATTPRRYRGHLDFMPPGKQSMALFLMFMDRNIRFTFLCLWNRLIDKPLFFQVGLTTAQVKRSILQISAFCAQLPHKRGKLALYSTSPYDQTRGKSTNHACILPIGGLYPTLCFHLFIDRQTTSLAPLSKHAR